MRNVDIRPVSLLASDAAVAELEAVLTTDERTRADRLRFPDGRRHFIVSRGALRLLLAEYLNVKPGAVRFSYGPRGKPACAEADAIQFNASHSGGLALFAFATDCELGVDIEQIRPVEDMHRIAARFFAPEEAAELKSLPTAQQERAFFHCWTRKESYIKATGEGLSLPLDSFRVTLRPDEPARMFGGEAVLHDLVIHREYAAALAYRGGEMAVTVHSCRHWPD